MSQIMDMSNAQQQLISGLLSKPNVLFVTYDMLTYCSHTRRNTRKWRLIRREQIAWNRDPPAHRLNSYRPRFPLSSPETATSLCS